MSTDAGQQGTPGGLRLALGLFTLIPVRPALQLGRPEARRAIAWFPWLGLLLGSAAGLLLGGLGLLGARPLLAGAVGLVALQVVTGFMHLDGLADTADGLGARKPGQDALAIMRKSDIGPMGVAAILCVLVIQLAALAQAPGPWPVAVLLGLSAMVARVSTLLATGSWVPAARSEGFGALFAGSTTPGTAVTTVLGALAVLAGAGWWLNGWPGALGLAGAALLAWALGTGWQASLIRRFGGLSGDMFGALVEVCAAVFLVCAVLTPAF